MPTQEGRAARTRVCDRDLIDGICYQLITMGLWRGYAPMHDETSDHRPAFDLSMWQALLWLQYHYRVLGREDDVHAYFRLQWLYGRSETVQHAMLQMLGYVFHTRVPYGGGVYYCNIGVDSAERLLESNSVDRGMLEELARRFSWEYQKPPEEREWPPDFDFDKEFRRS